MQACVIKISHIVVIFFPRHFLAQNLNFLYYIEIWDAHISSSSIVEDYDDLLKLYYMKNSLCMSQNLNMWSLASESKRSILIVIDLNCMWLTILEFWSFNRCKVIHFDPQVIRLKFRPELHVVVWWWKIMMKNLFYNMLWYRSPNNKRSREKHKQSIVASNISRSPTITTKPFVPSIWGRLHEPKVNYAGSGTWISFLHSFLSSNMPSLRPLPSISCCISSIHVFFGLSCALLTCSNLIHSTRWTGASVGLRRTRLSFY